MIIQFCARRMRRSNLRLFHRIPAMDMNKLTMLHRLGEAELWQKPKLVLSLRRLHIDIANEVPDPCGRRAEGFESMPNMLESAMDGFVAAAPQNLKRSTKPR
jgi:protein-tyrosine-phosphatase